MTSAQTLRPCVEAFCKEASLPVHAEELEALGSETSPSGTAARLAGLLRGWGAAASAIAGAAQLKEDYSGPLLAMIDQRSWVYVARFAASQAEGTLTLFDPRAGGYVTVKASQFLSRWQGPGIAFFSNEPAPAAARRHAGGAAAVGLSCLCLIGRHHGLAVTEEQLAHEYALGSDSLSLERLLEMARDKGMRGRIRPLSWQTALAYRDVFPLLAQRKDGQYAILCNVQKQDDGEMRIQALFPDAHGNGPADSPLRLMDEAAFQEVFAERMLLLKRRYHINDEDQPFGLAWFFPEFLRHKRVFVQIALAVLVITAISLLTPLFFQLVIDKVLPHKTYSTLNVLSVGIIGVILYNSLLEFLKSYLLIFATNKIDINLGIRTFHHLMRLPLSFFESIPAGVILKHIQQTEKIRGFLSGNLFFTLLDVFSLVVFIPFLMLYSVSLTAIVFVFSLAIALVVVSLIKPFQKRLDELYTAEGKRQSSLVESIRGIQTIKSLALEPMREKEWNEMTAFAVHSYFRVGKISITAKVFSQALEMIMNIVIIWYGAHLVFDARLSMGALIAFQMISSRVSSPLVKMVSLVHEYQQVSLSVRMLGVVMNSKPEESGGNLRSEVRGDISFHDVSFQYRPDTLPVINDFTLHIRPGEILGIVGRSGSGKSTIAKLVQAMYTPQQGFLRMDGIDIRELDKMHLRRNIGVVLQENYFFHGTIRDNIRQGRPDASTEDVIEAARLAGAHEFISGFHTGYDTILEENAVNLSGGQKQRLAIARALITSPKILIFDEATSALDPESEWRISQNLRQMAQGRTVIMIAHRLALMRQAHRIIVLDHGRLIEQGSHEELLAHKGLYNDFWTQQMGG